MISKQLRKDLIDGCKKWQIEKIDIQISRPQQSEFGDFSTNLPFLISSSFAKASKDKHKLKQSPDVIAKEIAQSIQNLPYIEKLEVKSSGFLNFFIKSEFWQKEVEDVLNQESKYGSNELGKGKIARVEFVSANPTGPLHFGNARGGPIGDVLALVLEFCGYGVKREYLHNDVGGQVEKLGMSIINVAKGEKLEDQEYKGWYVEELAKEIKKNPKSKIQTPSPSEAGKEAVEEMLKIALENCKKLGIKFDEVHRESEYAKSGKTKSVLEKLKSNGVLKEKDKAIWFAPSDEFLKDRETVVIKNDGSYTYFANDIAYHEAKFESNPDLVIDIFGADHHGHAPRLKSAVSALGFDESKFKVILYQWVRFKKGEEILKTSKRSGNIVTVSDVIEAIGPDAIRFLLLMHDVNSPIDFDLELAREKSSKNPVYYVQYAYARIESILAKSKLQNPNSNSIDYSLLNTDYELDLIKQITRLPELVEEIGQSFAVNRLTTYSRELADAFHRFYENCPVISPDKKLMNARLALLVSCKIALKNTLSLLGVSAPDKM